jgi:RHS repeat-associated protein
VPIEQSGTVTTSLGFTGEYTDPSGLLYLRARYANLSTATFLTKNPFEGYMHLVMSRNGYSYVHGNPVNLTDPSGEAVVVPLLMAAKALAAKALTARNAALLGSLLWGLIMGLSEPGQRANQELLQCIMDSTDLLRELMKPLINLPPALTLPTRLVNQPPQLWFGPTAPLIPPVLYWPLILIFPASPPFEMPNIISLEAGDPVPGLPGAVYDLLRPGGGFNTANRNYEVRVTGKGAANSDLGVYLQGRESPEFDWYDPENRILIDAKNWQDGGVHDLSRTDTSFIRDRILEIEIRPQAEAQIEAARGLNVTIEWRVAGRNTADALRQEFAELGYNIRVRHVP